MSKIVKSGLPANCNLADMFLKPPAPIVKTEAEVITAPAPAEEAVTPAIVNKIDEVPLVAPVAEKPLKSVKNKKPMAWKQTGISLSESVIMRLKLESFKSGKTLSEVADSILAKGLPNHKISA